MPAEPFFDVDRPLRRRHPGRRGAPWILEEEPGGQAPDPDAPPAAYPEQRAPEQPVPEQGIPRPGASARGGTGDVPDGVRVRARPETAARVTAARMLAPREERPGDGWRGTLARLPGGA